MPPLKLDGAGTQKMKTLEEALMTLAQIHGMVERMAVEMKAGKNVGIVPTQVKRVAGPLQGRLKGQFGMIADQVSAMILNSNRGGGDAVRLRTLREYVAQIRQSIEFAGTKVKEQHAVAIEMAPD
jgi:hypothetical protein